MMDATEQKTRAVLKKPYKELPVAKDLPRLASRIRIEDSHGKSLIPPPPPNAGPIDHLAALLKALYLAIEGEAEAQRIEKGFAEHFDNVTVVERIMEAKLDVFLSRVLMGDESRVVRLLKSCNQSAIAGAVIELKMTLGMGNTTKDVPNSWFFVISIGNDTITVQNKKREQAVDGIFQFEWVLSFTFERQHMECTGVSLKITELTWNPAVTSEKQEEVSHVLAKYLTTTATTKAAAKVEPEEVHDITLLPGEALLFKDKNATHMHAMGSAVGTVYVTNFRVVFDPENKKTPAADGLVRYRNLQIVEASCCDVPLTTIVNIRKKSSKIDLWCKDMRIVKIRFPPNTKCLSQFYDALVKAQPQTIERVFAFSAVRGSNQEHYWDLFSVMSEMKRLKVSEKWRVSYANADFSLCNAIGASFIVPASISDAELKTAAAYRSKNRIPTFCWRSPSNVALLRAGTPLSSARCSEDDKLLKDVVELNPNHLLYVVDCGAKSKSHVDSTIKLDYLELSAASTLRESFAKLGKAIHNATRSNESDWLPDVNSSRWLFYIQEILAASMLLVDHMERGRSVLIQEAEHADRSCQLSSLAQLLMDPYMRTVVGFEMLLEKEWLQNGHAFLNRCGHLPKIPQSDTAPIFLQFVDAVWQLMQQFPDAFEFSPVFLIKLMHHLYSCQHGNFICNSEAERAALDVRKKTLSLWSTLNSNPDSVNLNYRATKARVLIPSTNIKKLRLWTDYYFNWDPEMTPIECSEKRSAHPHEVPALQPHAPIAPDGVDKATLQMENIRLAKQLAEVQFELDQLRIERRLADQYEKKLGLDVGKKGSLKLVPGLASPKKKESLLTKWRKNSSSSLVDDPDAISEETQTGSHLSGTTPVTIPGRGTLVRTGSSPDLVPRLRAHTTSGLSQSSTEPSSLTKKEKKEKKEKKHKKGTVSAPDASVPSPLPSPSREAHRKSMDGTETMSSKLQAPVSITAVPLKR